MSPDTLIFLYCAFFSGVSVILAYEIVPFSTERSKVGDHPTTLGILELVAFALLIGMTVVFFVGFMMLLARDLLIALLI